MEQRPPRARSASAAFSLKSEKSYSSKGSKTKKEPLIETEEEKRKRELISKANPNAAMEEAQPSMFLCPHDGIVGASATISRSRQL